MYFDAGDIVDIYQDADTGIICCETKGKFDQEKWASFNKDDLAFCCDDNGDATCGLFK